MHSTDSGNPPKKNQKKAQNLQQQCIQQTQEFNCETTSKEPSSSKQKEERKKKSCKAKALQLIILYLMSEAVLSHTRFS